MSVEKIGVPITETFFVFDDNDDPVPGLGNGDFAKSSYLDGSSSILPVVTIAEIGGGAYSATYTLPGEGKWCIRWKNTAHNKRGWAANYRATADGVFALVDVENTVWDAVRADHADAGSMGEAARDRYQALVLLLIDKAASTDRYTVAFFRDGELVESGVADVTLEVIAAADGSDLIAETAMTQIGSSAYYKYSEPTNRVTKGAAYTAKVNATVDGVAMSWTRPVGRDS